MPGVVSPLFLGVTLGTAVAIRLLAARVPRDLLLIVASFVFIAFVAGHPLVTLPFGHSAPAFVAADQFGQYGDA